MIGAAHAAAYRQFAHRFGPTGNLHTVCDMNPDAARRLAADWGFAQTETDWRAVIANPEIEVVSVCLPNFLHTEVTLAALAAGKHVLCEKPLALDAASARSVAEVARKARSVSGTVFNYRRIPAIAAIKARIEAGDLGKPVQILVQFQCDYAADPLLPHSWRYELAKAGPGALLDVGTHAVDTMRFLFGDVAEVIGAISTISITERRLPLGATTGHGHVALSDKTAVVDNDDVMSALLRFTNGAQGYLSASRVAVGSGNRLTVEVMGTEGTARFTTEMPSFYEIALRSPDGSTGFTRVMNSPAAPDIGALGTVPHDAVSIGYAEWFGFMLHEFLTCCAEGRPFKNGSIQDGYEAVMILDEIQRASKRDR